MYVNKWLTFTASAPIQLSSGLTYCFPLWSESLKKTFGYSQTQLEIIGSAANIGGYGGILAGVMYDSLARHHRIGPRAVLLMGALVNSCGYLALWAAMQGVYKVQFWQVALLAALACSGGTWSDVSCVATNMRNFPNERGTVVGLMKAYVGLSASIYTTMYYAFFAPNSVAFLPFLAIAPAAIMLLATPFVNIVPFVQQLETHVQGMLAPKRRFLLAYQAVICLAVYQAGSAAWRAGHPAASSASESLSTWLAAGTLALLVPVLLLPLRSGGLRARPDEGVKRAAGWTADKDRSGSVSHPQQQEERGGSLQQPLLSDDLRLPANSQAPGWAAGQGETDVAAGPVAPAKGPPSRRLSRKRSMLNELPDLNPLQCLASLQFWLMFAACTAASGCGLMLLNNLTQVIVALGGSKDSAGVYTSMYSVFNCCGRLLVGYASERALHAWGVGRPVFLALVCLLAAGTAALAALVSSPVVLLPCAVLMGVAFGGCWALMPALASELFGLRHLATNYCMLQLAPATGGLAMASLLAGRVYQAAGRRHGDPPNTCFGQDCFAPSFMVAAGLNLLGAVLAGVLWYCTRPLYRLEYYDVLEFDAATDDEGGQEAA